MPDEKFNVVRFVFAEDDRGTPASFAAAADAQLLGENIILSFGHYDPTAPKAELPDKSHQATLHIFNQIAISRTAFSQLVAQSIRLLGDTEDRNTFGWKFVEEAIASAPLKH